MKRIVNEIFVVMACALPTCALAQPGTVLGLQPIDPAFHAGQLAAAPTPSRATLYASRLTRLREEALELQTSDGGTLTPAHAAVLQSKLDSLNAAFGVHGRRS